MQFDFGIFTAKEAAIYAANVDYSSQSSQHAERSMSAIQMIPSTQLVTTTYSAKMLKLCFIPQNALIMLNFLKNAFCQMLCFFLADHAKD